MKYLFLSVLFPMTLFANVSKSEYINKTLPLVSTTLCHPLINDMLVEVCYGINYAKCVYELSATQQACAKDMEKVLPEKITHANSSTYAPVISKCGVRRMVQKFAKKMKQTDPCKNNHSGFISE